MSEKSRAAMSEGQFHQELSSLSSDSYDADDFEGSNSSREKPNKSRGSNSGNSKVRCRYCLAKKCQLKNLTRHVYRRHEQYYLQNKKKDRKYFVAQKGQTLPEDPKFIKKLYV